MPVNILEQAITLATLGRESAPLLRLVTPGAMREWVPRRREHVTIDGRYRRHRQVVLHVDIRAVERRLGREFGSGEVVALPVLRMSKHPDVEIDHLTVTDRLVGRLLHTEGAESRAWLTRAAIELAASPEVGRPPEPRDDVAPVLGRLINWAQRSSVVIALVPVDDDHRGWTAITVEYSEHDRRRVGPSTRRDSIRFGMPSIADGASSELIVTVGDHFDRARIDGLHLAFREVEQRSPRAQPCIDRCASGNRASVEVGFRRDLTSAWAQVDLAARFHRSSPANHDTDTSRTDEMADLALSTDENHLLDARLAQLVPVAIDTAPAATAFRSVGALSMV